MNFAEKLNSGSFSQDISPPLAPNIQWDFEKAAIDVFEKIIPLIPGKQWKSMKVKILTIYYDQNRTTEKSLTIYTRNLSKSLH